MMKKIILGLCIIASAVSCKKIDNGFQSDNIRYKDNNIYAKRGLILFQSDRINADGSTPPYKYKLLNLRNENGSPLPKEFSTEYEITLFKPGLSFNAETDTTIELLNLKRETVKRLPMEFNETSGQLTFNRASVNLPLGRYVYDVQMTNPTGTKMYPSLATINVVDPTTDDLFTIDDNVANAFHDVTGAFTPMKNPKITCVKVSNEGARAILKIVDKNGVPFNPNKGEIIKRGDRPTFESYAKFNPVLLTDTALICDFVIAPFPLTQYPGYGFATYYRIPSQFATIDGFPATLGTFSVNPRWAWHLKLEGTYVIQIQLTDVTRKG